MTIRVDCYHHLAADLPKDSSLAAILAGILRLEKRMSQLDDAITALTAEVTAENTEIDSAIVFIKGVPALIQTAIDAAVAKGASPAQLQSLADLKTAMENKASDLAAALVAGTPSAGQTPTV